MPLFVILLLVSVLAGGLHAARLQPRSFARAADVMMTYLLVGYCGIPQIAIAVWGLLNPERAAGILGFPTGNPFQTFLSVAYLGMAIVGTLSAWYGGGFRVAAAILWAVFFGGANFIHMAQGVHSHAGAFHTYLTHLVPALLLAAALLASGLWRQPVSPAPS